MQSNLSDSGAASVESGVGGSRVGGSSVGGRSVGGRSVEHGERKRENEKPLANGRIFDV